MVMIGWCPSPRCGVAVNPVIARAGRSRSRRSTEKAGTWWPLVDDDVAVARKVEASAAGQRLDHRDVDPTGPQRLGRRSDLVGGNVEELGESVDPLLEQGTAVHEHEHERGAGARGDQRGRHHGLAGAGGRDEDADLVRCHRLDGRSLRRGQRTRERHGDRVAVAARIADGHVNAGLLELCGHVLETASR